MKKARVLIVDDAALIRRIITDALSADPTIEVAGEAEDGRTALQRIAQLKPDVVTLDIEPVSYTHLTLPTNREV